MKFTWDGAVDDQSRKGSVMSKKAAAYLEPETCEEFSRMSSKTVDISLVIDPDTKTFSTGSIPTVWPGDTLKWHVKRKVGASKLKNRKVVITLSRISDTETLPSLGDDGGDSGPDTLGSPLTLGVWQGSDGPPDVPGDPKKAVGFSVTLDGTVLSGGATTYLVIDTSGPPAGSGGGQHPCPPEHPEDRDCHEHHGVRS